MYALLRVQHHLFNNSSTSSVNSKSRLRFVVCWLPGTQVPNRVIWVILGYWYLATLRVDTLKTPLRAVQQQHISKSTANLTAAQQQQHISISALNIVIHTSTSVNQSQYVNSSWGSTSTAVAAVRQQQQANRQCSNSSTSTSSSGSRDQGFRGLG